MRIFAGARSGTPRIALRTTRFSPSTAGAAGVTRLTIRGGNPSARFAQEFNSDVSRGLRLKLSGELTLGRIGDAAIAEDEGPAPVRSLFDSDFGIGLVIWTHRSLPRSPFSAGMTPARVTCASGGGKQEFAAVPGMPEALPAAPVNGPVQV